MKNSLKWKLDQFFEFHLRKYFTLMLKFHVKTGNNIGKILFKKKI